MTLEEIQQQLKTIGEQAKTAAVALYGLSSEKKAELLRGMGEKLRKHSADIIGANAKDLEAAETKGMNKAMMARLKLDAAGVESMAKACDKVAELPDPLAESMGEWTRPNGLRIEQVRVPIGVIGMIYESRPNVTCDAAILCLKAGNATILRGGSEAVHSNRAIAALLQEAAAEQGLPREIIQLIPFTDRAAVPVMAGMVGVIDLIIPRGGHGLIQSVVENAKIPVIKHYDGVCHAYVDVAADLELALDLIDDGKTQKPSACNALETVLVHRELSAHFLPKLAERLAWRGVEVHACTESLPYFSAAIPANERDWVTEYLDDIIAIKIVEDADQAIAHINQFGSHHSDAIITTDEALAEAFLRRVESACVYHNASTRFSDGEEFGFGAEIGISTDKLHARGPMGLRELTSYQYRVRGAGQVKDVERLPKA